MAKHRLYIPPSSAELSTHSSITLDDATCHYTLNVLRLADASTIEIFDGLGNAYQGLLRHHGKRAASIEVETAVISATESPLRINLIQSLARGEKMDWIIQKAVELGVSSIQPITSERCNVKLDKRRAESRYKHWQGVIRSACEQCGRNTLPKLDKLIDINELSSSEMVADQHRWLLQPDAKNSLRNQHLKGSDSVSILIGPEGGFRDREIKNLSSMEFTAIKFGPRILRTETAAIAAITAIQSHWGDI